MKRIATFCLWGLLSAGSSPAVQQDEPVRGSAGDAERLSTVRVNGVRLAYRIDGSGFPLVFVHGEPYSHEQWIRQIPAFEEKYWVVTYDRRGAGQSEAPVVGYSPRVHALDLNAFLEFLGVREAHFVVNGRGGMILLMFLKSFPEKVRSLVFANPTLPLSKLSGTWKSIIERRRTEPIPSLEEALRRREERKTLSNLDIAQTMPEVRAIVSRMVDQYSPRVYMTPQRSDIMSSMDVGPWNHRDFPEMVSMVQPKLLVMGEHTDDFFLDGAREAHRLWPNTRHVVIPETDHLLMLESPVRFNELVLEFLEQVDNVAEHRDAWTGQVP